MTRVASRDGTTLAFEKAGNGPAVIEVLGRRSTAGHRRGYHRPRSCDGRRNSMDLMRPTADRIAHLMPRGERKTLKGQNTPGRRQRHGSAVDRVFHAAGSEKVVHE